MKFEHFAKKLNESIFEGARIDLLKKMAGSPERYIGIFRPTKPRTKIAQNLSQSQEIRFGDAMEDLIRIYLEEIGFENLETRIFGQTGDELNLDQHFKKGSSVYFAEQKVRDDHDASKKRGQMDNFEEKAKKLIEVNGAENVTGFFYFIDPSFKKNANFYRSEILKLTQQLECKLYLQYGEDFFSSLGRKDIWEEICNYLARWKETIDDYPEISFDVNPKDSFDEIKNLDTATFKKLLENDPLCDAMIEIIFPTKATLFLLKDYFHAESSKDDRYRELERLLGSHLK